MEDFDKICRTCLTESTDFKSLFIVQYVNEERLRLWEILRACTSIQILEDDALPKQVCAQCEHHILNAYSFIQQCHKSEAVLKAVAAESVKSELTPLETFEESSSQRSKISGNALIEHNQLMAVLIKKESSETVGNFDVTYEEEDSAEIPDQGEQLLASDYSIYEEDIKFTSELLKCEEEEDETLQPLFPCEAKGCCACFTSPMDLEKHGRVHPEEHGITTMHQPEKNSHVCSAGGRKYARSKELVRHVGVNCVGKTPYSCDSYNEAGSGEKPHVCTYCSRRYMTVTHLRRHMRAHAGEKPYHSKIHEAKSCNKLSATRGRRKHQCMFCDVSISNFSRHMTRNHCDELEVKEILSLSKNSPERKHLINKLRKEGDFRTGNCVPVLLGKKTQRGKNLLPCIYCKGYYVKTTLRYHVKKCAFNNRIDSSERIRYQSEAQTLMASSVDPNDPLRISGIFDSLAPDEVSLVAKQDETICEVARQYIKSNREKQVLAKNQMRRLARILIESRKMENNSKMSLLALLRPSKFKMIVDVVRKIAQYNADTKSFAHPSFAHQIGALLKKAINAAYQMEIQRDVDSSNLSLLTALRNLINDQWSSEIPTETSQNLQNNKFNKPTLISVTEDIAKMKQYLDNLIEQSMVEVKQGENQEAYRNLTDAIYCSLMFFNKRKVGELQRIPLDVYLNNHDALSSKQFKKLLTPSEQILFKSLKRIVINGYNRGKVVSVLFDKFIIAGIDLLIEKRDQYFVQSNQYLFGIPGTTTCINGHHVLRKHGSRALGDSTKTKWLTSTRLRKHLATIYQIFKMGNDELEQLAKFMGHDALEAYDEWYRLPRDVYRTAKVSKILLLSQNSCIEQFKGRNVDDNEIVENEKSDNEESDDAKLNDSNFVTGAISKFVPASAKKRRLIPWSQEEKQATEQFFKMQIKKKMAPKKNEVTELMNKHPHLFKNRNWTTIKVYIQNKYTKQCH